MWRSHLRARGGWRNGMDHVTRALTVFVEDCWEAADYDRLEAMGSEEVQRSVDQPTLIRGLSPQDVYAADHLRDLIVQGKVLMMDLESCAAFRAAGLFVGADNKIIIFNRR